MTCEIFPEGAAADAAEGGWDASKIELEARIASGAVGASVDSKPREHESTEPTEMRPSKDELDGRAERGARCARVRVAEVVTIRSIVQFRNAKPV